MKFVLSFALIHYATIAILVADSPIVDESSPKSGLYRVHFNADDDYVERNRNELDHPMCYAITNQKRLEITIEGTETVSSKEKKIISKKLIVEPYAFGIDKDGKPVLRGNVIEEKNVKEITIKYSEDTFNDTNNSAKNNEKNFSSQARVQSPNSNIDIRKVFEIKVIEDSHFDIPKNYQGLKDADIKVICQLPVFEKPS